MKSYNAKYPTDGSSKHIKRIAVFLLLMALLSGQLKAMSNFKISEILNIIGSSQLVYVTRAGAPSVTKIPSLSLFSYGLC